MIVKSVAVVVVNRALKGSTQAANSTVFQEMAPLFLCTYSTMEGSPLHMTSPMKVALKILMIGVILKIASFL